MYCSVSAKTTPSAAIKWESSTILIAPGYQLGATVTTSGETEGEEVASLLFVSI